VNFEASNTDFEAPNLNFEASNLDFEAPNTDFEASNTDFEASNMDSDASDSESGASKARMDGSRRSVEPSAGTGDVGAADRGRASVARRSAVPGFDAEMRPHDSSRISQGLAGAVIGFRSGPVGGSVAPGAPVKPATVLRGARLVALPW